MPIETNEIVQEADVEYTKSGVPKACPGCGHAFHPTGECEHEWREYGVSNPSEQRCECQRNMAVRLPTKTLLITTTTPPLPASDLRVEAALIQTRRELEEASTAIGRYYQNWDDADDARSALEALSRSIANLCLSVERIDERLTNEITYRSKLAERLDRHEMNS